MLIIEPPIKQNSEFKMIYYNADGSRAEMCGNGARCIAYYAYELELCEEIVNFDTDIGQVRCEIKRAAKVKLYLPEPKDLKLGITLKIFDNKELIVDYINTGVPHTVVFVDDIEKIDVYKLGQEIRYHRKFYPFGTNVDFVKVKDRHNLVIRTYERGVENETLSCGTGVTASAIISSIKGYTDPPIKCLTRSGEILTISFVKNVPEDMLSPVSELYLEGKVEHVFDGEIEV